MNFIKRFRYWIAVILLVVPILLRGVWYYQGLPSQPKIKTPNYSTNLIPQPPVSGSATETPGQTTGKVVVVDYLHSNQFSPSQVEAFFKALTSRGARVEIATSSPSLDIRLKYASAFVVFSPTASFASDEINTIRNFTNNGGRLIVFTDPTHGITTTDWYTGLPTTQPDVDYANDLLAPFGLTVRNDYLYDLVKNEGNFRNVLFTKFGTDALTHGLTRVAFYGAHSIDTTNGTPLLIGDSQTFSSLTDSAGAGMAGAALNHAGNVLALGDFTFLSPPYDSVADNSLLIDRIADFALGGSRTHDVANFPYVFDRSVSVVPTGGLQMNADVLGPFANLQNALLATNTSLFIRAQAPADGDLLIIGTLTPNDLSATDDLSPYIQSFKLGLDDPTTVTIPDFGTVDRAGIGLLLYKHTDTRNTLVLLTDSAEDLPSVIDLLASGYLDSCVFQGDIGVCSIGSSGNYYPEPTYPPLYPYETPTLPATPTPSG